VQDESFVFTFSWKRKSISFKHVKAVKPMSGRHRVPVCLVFAPGRPATYYLKCNLMCSMFPFKTNNTQISKVYFCTSSK